MDKHKDIILIIDDSPENIRVLTSVLEVEGYMVLQAVNGKLGLKVAANAIPDLILLDVRMPDMNGYEVCQHLKKCRELADIPVIFLSGLIDPSEKVAAFNAGGVDYVEKPIQTKEILARVKTHLELHRMKCSLEKLVKERTIEFEETNQSLRDEIRQHRITETKLRNSETRYRHLYHNTQVMMSTIASDGCLTCVNDHWVKMLGYNRDEVIGKQFIDFLTDSSRRYAIDTVMPVYLSTGRIDDVEFQLGKKSGDVIDVLLSCVRDRNETGNENSLAFMIDISNRKKLESQLHQKNEELIKSNQYKTEFLANMSHELRSPLNSVILLSKLLLENNTGNLSKTQIEYAEMINESGVDLLVLINDILDLSKIESGTMTLYIREVRFDELARHIQQTYKHVAENKGIELIINLSDSLPEFIWSDYQKIIQIMRNLISNAIKFTQKGTVTIDIGRPPHSIRFNNDRLKSGKSIAFSIADTGIGIPHDKQSEIFEAFKQVDGSISRKFGGTGLGLTISTKLSEMIDGEIHLTSIEGKGSTFTLYIPEMQNQLNESRMDHRALERIQEEMYLTDGNKKKTIQNIIDVRDEVLESKHILVVDDDVRNLYLMTIILEKKGMKTSKAISGEKALELLREKSGIDLVLMDIMMPGMDGYETIRQIRAMEQYKELPVVVITALAMKGDRHKVISAGADGYITKPVDSDKLFSMMHRLLDKG